MPRIYYCSYQYCAAVHPRCSTAKPITLLDKVWSLTMRTYVGIKANISLGTTAFSCFTLYFATTAAICILLRKQSTWYLLAWKLQVFNVLSKDKTSCSFSTPSWASGFQWGWKSAHKLWPSRTCLYQFTVLWTVTSFHSSQQQSPEEL